MKVTDLDSTLLSEAPVGTLSALGNKLASFVPGDIGDKALGRQQAGNVANRLRRKYSVMIGRTGQDIDALSLEQFLDNENLLFPSVKTMINASAPIDSKAADKIILFASQESAKKNMQQNRNSQNTQNTQSNQSNQSNQNSQTQSQQIQSQFNQLSKTQQIALLKQLVAAL